MQGGPFAIRSCDVHSVKNPAGQFDDFWMVLALGIMAIGAGLHHIGREIGCTIQRAVTGDAIGSFIFIHQLLEMLALDEILVNLKMTFTAALRNVLVKDGALLIGWREDACVGFFLAQSIRIAAVTIIAGDPGFIVGGPLPLLEIIE